MYLKVAFAAASFLTTQGHASIYNVIKTAVLSRGTGLFLPVFSNSEHMVRRVIEFKPDVVIADFPWSSSTSAIQQMRSALPSENTRFGVIDMYALADARVPDGLFDFSIQAEPNACEWSAPRVLDCWALLNNDARFAEISENDQYIWDVLTIGGYRNAKMRTVLVFQTGDAQEKQMLKEVAMHDVRRRRVNAHVIGSLDLPQPAARFGRLATHIVAAPGYSMTWELCHLGLLSKTTFFPLTRAVEDCKRRQDIVYTVSPVSTLTAGQNALASYLDELLARKLALEGESDG